VAVLFGIGPIAVAVFEIQTKILDRLAPQLIAGAFVDAVGQRGGHSHGSCEGRGIRRVVVERTDGGRPEPRRGIGLEEVRAAVDGVNRLTAVRS
jgi:hypothetical protein